MMPPDAELTLDWAFEECLPYGTYSQFKEFLRCKDMHTYREGFRSVCVGCNDAQEPQYVISIESTFKGKYYIGIRNLERPTVFRLKGHKLYKDFVKFIKAWESLDG